MRTTKPPIARRRLLACAALAFFLSASTFTNTGHTRAVGDEGAGAFLASLTTRAIAQLTDTSVAAEERKLRFRGLFRENFDVPAIGRFVLGRYWRPTSAEARRHFLNAFEDVMVERFVPQFAGFAGTNFRVVGVHPLRDKGQFIVSSTATPPDGQPVQINWRVRLTNGRFKVLDVTGEGVSMALTLRSEYASVIKNAGGRVESLTTLLRERIQETN